MSEYLHARIRALENEIERLRGIIRSKDEQLTQQMEQRVKNIDGYKIDINDPVFHTALKDIVVNE